MEQAPAFFKVYLPDSSSQRMKLPPVFVQKILSIPRKLFLRNRCGKQWTVALSSIGNNMFFQGVGWVQFVKDNNLVEWDFLTFYYNGTETFDFQIFGLNGCEKIDEDDVEEKVDVEEDNDKDGVPEEGEDELEANADEDYEITRVDMQDEDEDEEGGDELQENSDEVYEASTEGMQGEDKDREEEEEAGENSGKRKRNGKKKTKGEVIDIYGADIFKSGRYTQPENPYFVTKMRGDKRDQLYIPVDFIKDMEHKLPKKLTVRDPRGKTYRLKLNDWNDGRVWYKDGWSRFCRSNCVGAEDRIICEFIRRDEMHIRIIRPGNSSN